MPRLVRAGLISLLVAVVAACSSQTPSATETPTAAPVATAQATPTPTQAAGATSSLALPSFVLPHNATELEALLPATIGGKTLTKASWSGADFFKLGVDPQISAFLQSLGKSPSDVSVATAGDAAGDVTIFAFRVAGVDHSVLIPQLETALSGSNQVTWVPATVGGKSVQQAQSTQGSVNDYLYGTADLVFDVSANAPADVAEALSKLP